MPAERIAMRQVREILRLITVEKLSVREIARRTGKAPSTVRAMLGRFHAAGSLAQQSLLAKRGSPRN